MSPINVDRLKLELEKHPDRKLVDNLITGLKLGFDAMVSPPDLPTFECKNIQSAVMDPDTVDSLLKQEIEKGYIKGPFASFFLLLRIELAQLG